MRSLRSKVDAQEIKIAAQATTIEELKNAGPGAGPEEEPPCKLRDPWTTKESYRSHLNRMHKKGKRIVPMAPQPVVILGIRLFPWPLG